MSSRFFGSEAKRWADKTFFGLADQAVFAGSMFTFNILLARWTSAEEYGAFVVLFAILLILAGLHNALVIEPMAVFGSQEKKADLPAYLRDVAVLHFAVVATISCLSIVIALCLDSLSLNVSKWGLPIAAPFVLCFWLSRRALYVAIKPRAAFFLSVIHAFFVIGGLIILRGLESLTTLSSLLLLGTSSLLISVLPLRGLLGCRTSISHTLQDTLNKHWKYGRWALGESLMSTLASGVFPLMLAYFGAMALAGQFRAVQIIFLPITHTLIGLSLLALPGLARVRPRPERFANLSRLIVALFVGLTLAYVTPVVGFGEQIVGLLYVKPEYLELVWLFPHLGLAAIIAAGSASLMLILRAAEQPRFVFFATVVSASVTVFLGLPLTEHFGPAGLVATLLMSSFLGACLLAWFSRPFLSAYPTLGHVAREPTNV